jgi:hypothetical protein
VVNTFSQLSNCSPAADNPDMLSRRSFGLLLFVLTSLSLWAAKEFVAPRAENANTYPSKDAHPREHVTVAIDLYDSPPKSQIFSTPYAQDNILPVLLIVSNDGDQPISLLKMQAELVTATRTKLEALTTDDVYRRVAHISASSTNPGRAGPLPLPGKSSNKKASQSLQELIAAHFAAEAVEPHTTRSGFLFFDIADVKQPTAGAHIYLTGVRDNNGDEMLYFEIPVIPANAATQ